MDFRSDLSGSSCCSWNGDSGFREQAARIWRLWTDNRAALEKVPEVDHIIHDFYNFERFL